MICNKTRAQNVLACGGHDELDDFARDWLKHDCKLATLRAERDELRERYEELQAQTAASVLGMQKKLAQSAEEWWNVASAESAALEELATLRAERDELRKTSAETIQKYDAEAQAAIEELAEVRGVLADMLALVMPGNDGRDTTIIDWLTEEAISRVRAVVGEGGVAMSNEGEK